ncbi:RNA-binding domain-containing protein [Marasmius fiardii PR-910]|nr:RNA-binding domain-containing protein [Marasmius fiardii PR-910]
MSRLLTKTFASHLATSLRTSNSRALSLLASRQSTLSSLCSSPISSARGIRRNSSHVLNLASDDVENKSALESVASTPPSSGSPHEVFVGQLPWHFDNARLAQEFASCGEIISANVITQRNTGKSRGFGFIKFSTSDGAEMALKLNEKEIDGQTITVERKESHQKSAPESDASTPSSRSPHTVFVSQLPWHFDNDRLAQEFASCGEIISANVITQRNTGKSRGFGFVNFSTSDGVEMAVKLNGKEIDGQTITVERKGGRQSPYSDTLYVGNLPYSATQELLWKVFDEWRVKRVVMGKNRDTGRPQGYAFVEFETLEDAKAAFDTHKSGDIDGRSLKLDFARPPSARSLSDSGGGGRGGFGGGRGGFRGGRGGGRRGSFNGGRGGFNGGGYGRRSEGGDF